MMFCVEFRSLSILSWYKGFWFLGVLPLDCSRSNRALCNSSMYFTASSMTVTWNTTPKLINTMQEQTKLCNHYEDVRLDRSIGFLIQKQFFFSKIGKELCCLSKILNDGLNHFYLTDLNFLSLQKMKRPLFHQPVNLGYRVCTWITFQL